MDRESCWREGRVDGKGVRGREELEVTKPDESITQKLSSN
jgi:hypothetical protein